MLPDAIEELSDPERRLALAYVPAARRPALTALWTLDERLARIALATREPGLARIRLAWWRDALAALDGGPPPAEPLLRSLARDVLPVLPGAELAGLADGWDALLPLDQADFAAHAAERGERLFALSGRLLGRTPPAGEGSRWALADLARLLPGRPVPPPGPPGDRRWPGPLRPLGMLAVLAARDPAERRGSPARLLRMVRHRLTGR